MRFHSRQLSVINGRTSIHMKAYKGPQDKEESVVVSLFTSELSYYAATGPLVNPTRVEVWYEHQISTDIDLYFFVYSRKTRIEFA